jgi:hypothetical protein
MPPGGSTCWTPGAPRSTSLSTSSRDGEHRPDRVGEPDHRRARDGRPAAQAARQIDRKAPPLRWGLSALVEHLPRCGRRAGGRRGVDERQHGSDPGEQDGDDAIEALGECRVAQPSPSQAPSRRRRADSRSPASAPRPWPAAWARPGIQFRFGWHQDSSRRHFLMSRGGSRPSNRASCRARHQTISPFRSRTRATLRQRIRRRRGAVVEPAFGTGRTPRQPRIQHDGACGRAAGRTR